MDIAVRQIDVGTGYGVGPRTYKRELIEVGPGTPMGELMRRYWQPVFASDVLTSDRPHRIRVLGEDLILFRDKSGKPGLVHEHCCHRGTSLYYGRIEEDGIRCCYHGWKFDVNGHCLEQPAEVDKGRNRDRVRQPWYPVQERYGLVYAYMGPPEKKPVLPRWAHLEDLGPDETIEVSYSGGYGPPSEVYEMRVLGFSWLQSYENIVDAAHFAWLHYEHSGDQFGLAPTDPAAPLPPPLDVKDMASRLVSEPTPLGMKSGHLVAGPDGKQGGSYIELALPTAAIIPLNFDMGYNVPMDDENHLSFLLRRKTRGHNAGLTMRFGGKFWREMTEEEHQRFPGDYEAQASIGRTPGHNQEHMSQSDAGVGMLRRLLENAVRDVQEGRDPPGLVFNEDAPPLQTEATFRTIDVAA